MTAKYSFGEAVVRTNFPGQYQDVFSRSSVSELQPDEKTLVHEYLHFIQNFTNFYCIRESIWDFYNRHPEGKLPTIPTCLESFSPTPYRFRTDQNSMDKIVTASYNKETVQFSIEFLGRKISVKPFINSILENQIYLFDKGYQDGDWDWEYIFIGTALEGINKDLESLSLFFELVLQANYPIKSIELNYEKFEKSDISFFRNELKNIDFDGWKKCGGELLQIYKQVYEGEDKRIEKLSQFIFRGIQLRKDNPCLFTDLILMDKEHAFKRLKEISSFIGYPFQ